MACQESEHLFRALDIERKINEAAHKNGGYLTAVRIKARIARREKREANFIAKLL